MAVSDHRDTDSGGTAPGGLVDVGRTIQERREALGLSAEQLAGNLHLGVEQLRSLELGDLQGLPEPVFIKAMVRRIAGHLKLDADALAEQLGTISSTPTRTTINITAPASTAASPARERWSFMLPIVLVIAAGGGGAMLLRTRTSMPPVQKPAEMTEEPMATPAPKPSVPEAEPVSAAPSEPLASSLTISSREPSWIALRRNGNLEFQGTLVNDRTVDDPESVEIYAGRPDLVMVKRPGGEAAALGPIDAVRWYRLSPEL